MSVIVKGMKMPKTCSECMDGINNNSFFSFEISMRGAKCPMVTRIVSPFEFSMSKGIHPECPLKEVEE